MHCSPANRSTSYFNFILLDFSVSFWCDSAKNLLMLIDGVFEPRRGPGAKSRTGGGLIMQKMRPLVEWRRRTRRKREVDRWRGDTPGTWPDWNKTSSTASYSLISEMSPGHQHPQVLFHPSTGQTIWRRLIQLIALKKCITVNNQETELCQPRNNADQQIHLLLNSFHLELQHDL